MFPVDIKKSADNKLTIIWDDSHESLYDMVILRKNCPCATCKNLRDNPAQGSLRVLSPNESIPSDIRVTQAEIVGRYAVQFTWSDGHHEGIFSFEYLRELCQCENCQKSG